MKEAGAFTQPKKEKGFLDPLSWAEKYFGNWFLSFQYVKNCIREHCLPLGGQLF